MNKYKVEITKTFCLDVFAEDEEKAKANAENDLLDLETKDMQHYNQTGDTEFLVYDVTDTDDHFDPLGGEEYICNDCGSDDPNHNCINKK